MVNVQVEAYSDDPRVKVQEVYSVKVDVEEAIVTAYAEALASVSTVYDVQGCYAYGNAEGCIVTENEVICASCQVESVGESDVIEIDAIATASTSPISCACGMVSCSLVVFAYCASNTHETDSRACIAMLLSCS